MSQHSVRYEWSMRIEFTVKILEERLARRAFLMVKILKKVAKPSQKNLLNIFVVYHFEVCDVDH